MSTRVSLCLEQGQSANTRAQQQNKARPCKKKRKKESNYKPPTVQTSKVTLADPKYPNS